MNRPLSLTDPSGFIGERLRQNLPAFPNAVEMPNLNEAIDSFSLSEQDRIVERIGGAGSGAEMTTDYYIDGDGNLGFATYFSGEIGINGLSSRDPLLQSDTINCRNASDYDEDIANYGIGIGAGKDKTEEDKSNPDVTAAIDFMAGTDWGKSKEGKTIVNELRKLNKQGNILIGQRRGRKDRTWAKGKYVRDKNKIIIFDPMTSTKAGRHLAYEEGFRAWVAGGKKGEPPTNPSNDANKAATLSIMLVHEGKHRVDHKAGGSGWKYTQESELDAYDMTKRYYDKTRGEGSATMNPTTPEWIEEYYPNIPKK